MEERRQRIWIDGLVTGLLGYATVALFFAVANALVGRSPFYTSALLGGVLFYGVRDPGALDSWAGPVLAFNGLHLLVFLAIGVAVAWLASRAEGRPQIWYIGISVLFFAWIHLYIAVLFFSGPIRTALPLWMITGASVAAAGVMGVYLWQRHPLLRREVRTEQGGPEDPGQ